MIDAKKPPIPRRHNTAEMPAAGGSKEKDRRADKDSSDKDSSKDVTQLATETVRLPPPSGRWEAESGSAELMRTAKLGASPPTIPRPSRVPRSSDGPKKIEGIELIVVDEKQVAGGERRPWRAAEVWTKRRVYGLDSTFRCVEILDRQTGRPELTHEMLGARLGGGRLRDKETVRFSYPLPLPGMEAMFSKGKKHGYTSPVEKMIVRVRVLHTSADEASPSWDDIASRWSDVPPKL